MEVEWKGPDVKKCGMVEVTNERIFFFFVFFSSLHVLLCYWLLFSFGVSSGSSLRLFNGFFKFVRTAVRLDFLLCSTSAYRPRRTASEIA
jgi:hypothetical protein